jgi:hypothetical protein
MKRLDEYLTEQLRGLGTDLSTVGVNNYGWTLADALQVIDALEAKEALISGGDLWYSDAAEPYPAHANWYCDLVVTEPRSTAVTLCAERARSFIASLIVDEAKMPLVEIVIHR